MDIQKKIKDQVNDFQFIRRDITNWEKEMKSKEKKLQQEEQCGRNRVKF